MVVCVELFGLHFRMGWLLVSVGVKISYGCIKAELFGVYMRIILMYMLFGSLFVACPHKDADGNKFHLLF